MVLQNTIVLFVIWSFVKIILSLIVNLRANESRLYDNACRSTISVSNGDISTFKPCLDVKGFTVT